MFKKASLTLFFTVLLAVFLVACQAETVEVEVTRVVTQTEQVEVVVTEVVEIAGEQVEVTRVVVEEVEVVIEPTEAPAPQGGFLIESTFADAEQLNPILSADSASSDVNTKLYLGLLKLDEFSGEVVGEVANSWDVSEDGLTYTFSLRDDIVWSDGTPLTANDVKFTYDAIAAESVETPRKSNVELVDSINVLDDYTLEIVFNTIDCTALQNFTLGILPAHAYAADFSDIMDSPENTAPTVASGPFVFEEWLRDDHVTLVSNPDYHLGAPNVEGWTFRVFADQSAELEAVLAGEIDVTGVGPQYVSIIEGAIASGEPLEMKKFFDDGYTYVGFNMADPENPQPGWVDENGNEEYDEGEPPLVNDPHPIFSDADVRRAVSQAIDYTGIINKVIFGQGIQAVTDVLPAVEWAFNSEVEPYAFDMEAAAATLEEAGWVEGGDGVRAKDGTRLSFGLMTNAGNEVRENIAALMKDTLEQIGFEVELEILEWGTVVPNLLGQTYDAVIIGWTGLGSDPENTSFWAYRNDSPGGGFNFVSYYNETVESAINDARSLAGCDTAARGDLYKVAQQELHDDAPYAFLYVPLGNVIWNTRVNAIDPGPWATYYNVQDWYITP